MGVKGDFSNSARIVPLQHAKNAVLTASGSPPAPATLQPNQLQLYSYWKPGLEAGRYVITAEQKIKSHWSYRGTQTDEEYHIYNTTSTAVDHTKIVDDPPIEDQQFEVIAPQFSLDPKLINSFYPPSGHQDEARILPHICLEDAHFPWERQADVENLVAELEDPDLNKDGKMLDSDGNVVTDVEDAAKRNCVPWIALMVFDFEDLPQLTQTEVNALQLPSRFDINKQASNGAFQLSVAEYLGIPKEKRVNYEGGEDATLLKELNDLTNPRSQEKMTAIFPKKSVFKKLFPSVANLKYAAHVRDINTTGFPDAGIDQNGIYSIVVSSRTGRTDIVKPTVQICHLVSVEYFETTRKTTLGTDPDERIALVSLFSWTYMALPPNPVNFVDTIKHCLSGMQFLRPQADILKTLQDKATATNDVKQKKMFAQLIGRLTNGYTIARWRTETGEETAAFSRGPLVPRRTPVLSRPTDGTATFVGNAPVVDWPFSSKTGKEYQIFDTTTGLMDLSYSAAWALGKSLAISDTSFNAALSRFRSTIQQWAQSEARKMVNEQPARAVLGSRMASVIHTAATLSSGNVPEPLRLPQHNVGSVATSLTDAAVNKAFVAQVKELTLRAGSTVGGQIYNDLNLTGHNNSDWTVIHKWISEKLYLSDIPAHYFIPDPSFLPEESVRFFNIDDTWMDCLIDGALSVANHLDTEDDWLRSAIKATYNQYLASPYNDDGPTQLWKPQIPGYGFILRSQIVKVMPDMRITVTWQSNPAGNDGRHPYCRWMKPDDHTLLCLLDRPPEELDNIELAQPPHQQRFAFGDAYVPGAQQFEFQLRQLYTSDDSHGKNNVPANKWDSLPNKYQAPNQPTTDPTTSWIDPTSRVISLARMASFVNSTVRTASYDKNSFQDDPRGVPKKSLGYYDDYVPNSAELALELNDPSYYFLIRPFKDPTSTDTTEPMPAKVFSVQDRQIWAPANIGIPDDKGDSTHPETDSKPIATTAPQLVPQPTETANHINGDIPAQANVIPFRLNPTPVPAKSAAGNTQILPQFTLNVYVDYKGPPIVPKDGRMDKKNFLPTQNTYLYDLIFSVRRIHPAGFKLRELIVEIPHLGVSSHVEPALDAGAKAPRARMLSNQRFVPFLNWTNDMLQVRLVPRSAQQHPTLVINDDRASDVSFRLEEVVIVPTRLPVNERTFIPFEDGTSERLAKVNFSVTELYEVDNSDGSQLAVVSASPVFVCKVPKRDVKDVDEPTIW